MTRNFALFPLMVVIILVSLPLMTMYGFLILDTFTDAPPGELWPDEFTLRHWRFLWDMSAAGNVWMATLNTAVLALSMVAVVVPVSSLAGYAISRLNLPYRRFFLAGILVMHAFPAVTLLIGVFFVLKFTGLYNTMIGVILVKGALMLPFGIWIMKGFYDAVPWEIEMAGVQDGASRLTVFWRLIVPQVKPGLVALSVFAFLDGWGEYLLPRVLAPGSEMTVMSVLLNQLIAGDDIGFDFNLFKTVGVFYTLPVIALFVIFQNRLMTIFGGGTKG
ncbi:carbohydrate ABC transporter permease [Allosediminivita pacifica]|uniref:Maltose/maltodextrin transport system permease protein MalG n=1 Tax=Allosediminivita pacifica TaxID=1267769 RepID=A0A2T6A4F7_9RHOB|nr:carbohydrate ABC transporter permease [Allosediminivita pacifica]PTX38678.1 carbohydrate ABC transporter membrane protein 2 (CUT1 family) [Allosediminivita pacifica]GGB28862.1 sugar ABC transporter permease [Allosediminivita pacifica]